MTNSQSHDDGSLDEAEYEWLRRRAEGGFGMLITAAAHVTVDGKGWVRQFGVFDDRLVTGLSRLASMVQQHGALGVVQLHHGGARCPSALNDGRQPLSASEFDLDIPRFERPREASPSEIAGISEAFAAAARRVVDAGFAGVEIHAANGYLLSQFLSTQSNFRRDDWGGPLSNRACLLRQTVARVRQTAGPQAIIGVRLSPERARWLELDFDESLQVARWLAEDGIDYLHLSMDAAYDGPLVKLPNKRRASSDAVVTCFRRELPRHVALMAAGGVWTHADGVRALELGVDLVAVGRAAILNPDWPCLRTPPRRPPLTWAQLEEVGVGGGFRYMLERMRYIG